MPYAQSFNARIYYETRGDASGVPALFIEGFGVQMIGWREAFLQKFVERGVRVIFFDNRDVGLSQKFGGPSVFDAGYSLEDMADDAFGVLDALCLESAHVVGQSMGGMITQIMALRRPKRVRSLSLFCTAPGLIPFRKNQEEPARLASAEIYAYRPKAEAIEAFVQRERLAQSTVYPFNEIWIREWAARSFDRCYAPDGVARQAAAIRRLPDRIGGLDSLRHASLVIHGRDDGHIDVAAALELARLLQNFEAHIYPGLGHEIAELLWNEWFAMIMRTMLRGSN